MSHNWKRIPNDDPKRLEKYLAYRRRKLANRDARKLARAEERRHLAAMTEVVEAATH